MHSKKRTSGRSRDKLVFFFDVDNTLLDNDGVLGDVRRYLTREVGRQRAGRYWKIFEKLRDECQYADYLGALQRYREQYLHDTHLLKVSHFLIDYPFARRLYDDSLKVIRRARHWGTVALLSDGDVVFQPRKVERSGLEEAVGGRVLIYVHKQDQLRDAQRRFPADHYVVVDDKLHVLAAIKKIWRNTVTTVFVRQGHYAFDRKILSSSPPADMTIEGIGDLLKLEKRDFAEVIANEKFARRGQRKSSPRRA
jgi:FMN phosphatase YigB (HAD superfamily)